MQLKCKTLTVREAAQVLGISETLVRRSINAGELAAAKIGGRIIIPVSAVEALIGDVDLEVAS